MFLVGGSCNRRNYQEGRWLPGNERNGITFFFSFLLLGKTRKREERGKKKKKGNMRGETQSLSFWKKAVFNQIFFFFFFNLPNIHAALYTST